MSFLSILALLTPLTPSEAAAQANPSTAAPATRTAAEQAVEKQRFRVDSVRAEAEGICRGDPNSTPFRRVATNAASVSRTLDELLAALIAVEHDQSALDFGDKEAARAAFATTVAAELSKARALKLLTEAIAHVEQNGVRPATAAPGTATARVKSLADAHCDAAVATVCVSAKRALLTEYCAGARGLVPLSP